MVFAETFVLIFKLVTGLLLLSDWSKVAGKSVLTASLGEGSLWSACSTTCGPGVQTLQSVCYVTDIYGLRSPTSMDKCAGLTLDPSSQHQRVCNLGPCDGYYYWKEGEWSPCSQTCGPLGSSNREVQCLYVPKEGSPRPVNFVYCDQTNRPILRQRCNRFDCPPVFKPANWGRCPKPRNACEATRRTRSLSCAATLTNGTIHTLPNAACYVGGKRPPTTWEMCYDHVNSEECLKRNNVKPVIFEKHATILQMRRTEQMDLHIGQEAYLLPGTSVAVRCPVNYFIQRLVTWSHEDSDLANLTHTGESATATAARVRVDVTGSLRIKKFLPKDAGTWICHAGPSQAMVTLKVRSPAAGYADWAYRNSLWSEDMLNEAPKDILQRRELTQWVTQPWSQCSVTCGTGGHQTRVVRCEKVDTHLFTVLNDTLCINEGLPKPPVTRDCTLMTSCPKWGAEKSEDSVCMDKCIDVGLAVLNINISCIMGDRVVSNSECSTLDKPDITCPNPNCTVMWRSGPWSKCSISCSDKGEVGRRTRYLACVWKHSGRPAGFTCYRNNLDIPAVVEKCSVPQCHLSCEDLQPTCSEHPQLCRHSIYRSQCCATCTTDTNRPNGNSTSAT